MKICYVASSGGHWEELMCLKELFERYDSFYITESGGQAAESQLYPIYTVPQINRKEKGFVLHFGKIVKEALRIFSKEKPDIVITTGALIAFPFCLIGKIKGAKIIYIESFARICEPSLTGRLCYFFADLFLVQWKELMTKYPKAKYVGGIF